MSQYSGVNYPHPDFIQVLDLHHFIHVQNVCPFLIMNVLDFQVGVCISL
jgi:hypothetical protein